jgi:septum site-determining protein MinC
VEGKDQCKSKKYEWTKKVGIKMLEPVNIKGTRKGLVILFDSSANFEDIKGFLQHKMESAKGFFKGAKFTLHHEQKFLQDQIAELEKICTSYGLIPTEEPIEIPTMPKKKSNEAEDLSFHKYNNAPPDPQQTLLIKRTLRSGQNITYPGHVVVLGDVNAGAEIIAGGSIMVLGRCNGVVHAGAMGDSNAKVIATRLCPTQLRIGSAIVRSPEDEPQYPEIAKVKDNLILVEKYQPSKL